MALADPPPFEYVAPQQDVGIDATSVTVPFGIRQNTTPVLNTRFLDGSRTSPRI